MEADTVTRSMEQEYQILVSKKDRLWLNTGCETLDRFISYGGKAKIAFDFNRLIEIYGEAGSGKTQLGLQLALNGILDNNGEPRFKAFYVTTQKHLHEVKRDAFARGISKKLGLGIEQQKIFKESLMLRHITEVAAFDQFMKQEIISLAAELESTSPLKVLVIDNISTIAKQLEGGDNFGRHRRDKYLIDLYDTFTQLIKLGVHIVVINNLAANFKAFDEQKKLYKNVSSLGDLWTYLVTDKFELMKQFSEGRSNMRLLRTHFSKNGPKSDAFLEILDDGIFMTREN